MICELWLSFIIFYGLYGFFYTFIYVKIEESSVGWLKSFDFGCYFMAFS